MMIVSITRLACAAFLAVAILTACASIADRSLGPSRAGKDYDLKIVDNPSKARFELEFLSKSDRAICISYGRWPASEEDLSPASQIRIGSLSFMSDYVYVLTEGRRIPIKTTNFGYCIPPEDEPNGCSTIVQPYDRLTGVIPYAEFDGEIDPSPNVERQLIFEFAPHFCR